jgi:hypothetical protein
MTYSCLPPSHFSLRRFGVVKVSLCTFSDLCVRLRWADAVWSCCFLPRPPVKFPTVDLRTILHEVWNENIFQTLLPELALLPPRPLPSMNEAIWPTIVISLLQGFFRANYGAVTFQLQPKVVTFTIELWCKIVQRDKLLNSMGLI